MIVDQMNNLHSAYTRIREIRHEAGDGISSYAAELRTELEVELHELRNQIGFIAVRMVFDPSLAVTTRAQAAVYLAESHYDLARTFLERSSPQFQRRVGGYDKLYKLPVDTYIENWLWSQGDLLPQEVLVGIAKLFSYQPKRSHFLDKGNSIYREPMDVGR